MTTTMSPTSTIPASTSSDVLNPVLFALLQVRFGHVRVVHRGERRVMRQVVGPGGQRRFETVQRGEQYAVNCRFCNDTHRRLFVGYTFGTVEPGRSVPNYRLWCCHNETHCHNQGRYQIAFASLLGRPHIRLETSVSTEVNASVAPATSRPAMRLPEGRTILDLVPNHPAIQYLAGVRHFDIPELANVWGVGYCQMNLDLVPNFCNRIVAPVWRPRRDFGSGPVEWELAGWQARFIGDELPAGEPKYYSADGMPTSELWYGLPQALSVDGPVAIVEGATDVWRLRAGGLALLGSNLPSRHQLMLIQHYFSHRPLVILLDGDAHEKAIRIEQQLKRLRMVSTGDRRVVRVDLPCGKDPADLPRHEIWAIINDAVQRANND